MKSLQITIIIPDFPLGICLGLPGLLRISCQGTWLVGWVDLGDDEA